MPETKIFSIRHFTKVYVDKGFAMSRGHGVIGGVCLCHKGKDCPSPGKHPSDQSWSPAGDDNIMIKTGATERYGHLIVVDVDPRNGGDDTVAKWLLREDFRPENVVSTGGGGYHYYFYSDVPIPCSSGRLGPGVDVKGTGGLVVAPPSTHASGHAYAWVKTGVMQLLPEFIREMALSKDRPGLASVGRNTALTSLGGRLRREGLSESEILASISSANDRDFEVPLGLEEVAKIAKSVSSYPAGPIVESFRFLTEDEMANPLPMVKWNIKDLGIAPGAVTIFGGAGYTGKTMALQAASVAMACGLKVWGHFEAEKSVCVHIDYEQGSRLLVDRYQRICNNMEINIRDIANKSLKAVSLPKFKLDDPTSMDLLKRALDGANVCVIDSFKAAFPGVIENDSGARKYLDSLQSVSEQTGCTMIVIAHARKASEDSNVKTSLRGSAAIFDAGQTVYMLESESGKPSKVHCTKDRLSGNDRETFGLRICDHKRGTNAKYGLSVEYVSSQDLESSYENKESPDVIEAKNSDAIAVMKDRIVDLVSNRPDLSFTQIKAIMGNDKRVLASMELGMQRGELIPSDKKLTRSTTYTAKAA